MGHDGARRTPKCESVLTIFRLERIKINKATNRPQGSPMQEPSQHKPKLVEDIVKVAVKAPVKVVSEVVDETAGLLKDSGELKVGYGMVTGVLALTLGFLCLLGVLAFWFPQYLTTPELRREYSVPVLRQVLFYALWVAGGLSLSNVVLNKSRPINAAALGFVLVAAALGGSKVPVGDFPDHTPYIGLDWFILDLLGSTLIFVLIEKLFPLYKGQAVFRREWQTDLTHFGVNHFIVGLVLLTVNFLIHRVFGWMVHSSVQEAIDAIAFVPQLLLCILVAAPRLPRGALFVALPCRAPQRQDHGLDRRLAHARAGADLHPRGRAGPAVCAGLRQGRDGRLHHRGGLPGRVQPRQCAPALGADQVRAGDAGFPPLAPLV